VSEIQIPTDLRPRDGRFGSGPSKIRSEAVAALYEASAGYLGTSHRQATVRSKVARLREGLRDLFSLPDGYEVVLGVGGTTVFWDALAFCLVERRSQHTVHGEFSAKCAAAVKAAAHLDDPEIIEAEPGTQARPRPSDVDLYSLIHNETSTGVASEIKRPAGDALVAVDATSAAAGLPISAADFDVYYFSPQKGFASEGGLWVALCSPPAIERIERIASSDRAIPPSLDLKIALEESRKDQTFNTPALATIFLMVEQVDWLLDSGGLRWSIGRSARSADILYGWADKSEYATPFVADPSDRSNVVGTIDFDDSISAPDIARVLRANGIVDTEPYRKLGRNQLRIGMYPAVEPSDVELLTKSIDYVVDSLDSDSSKVR
jgi:phosphoserine aminotransferase